MAIYEKLLPDVCSALDPTRPYWPGSPYGAVPNGTTINDPAVGDRHAWDVWHGSPMPGDYHQYAKFAGRFVSEFGMLSMPSRTLIDTFAAPAEQYPQSRTLEHHDKATAGPQRLATYLASNLRLPGTLDEYIYATQFIQAEALMTAYRDWRRRWAGPQKYATAGALVWQLNDCWPVASWALVDSMRIPKPAYYVVRRMLAPITVGIAPTESGADVWAVNNGLAGVEAQLKVQWWTLDGVETHTEQQAVRLLPNQATELGNFSVERKQPIVFSAQLIKNDTVIARFTLWPEPFKYLTLPNPGVTITSIDADTIQVSAQRPAKGVWLSAPGRVKWNDNMLDLLPGDSQRITAPGLDQSALKVVWLTL